MPAMKTVYEGTRNIPLKLRVMSDGEPENISTATIKQYEIMSPDGISETVTAAFDDDGTDGILTYTFPKLKRGVYVVNAYVKIGSFEGPTDPVTFEVQPRST